MLGAPFAPDVICHACHTVNRANAKHCRRCGALLTPLQVCPHCQTENRAQAHHCQHCGKPLGENAAPALGKLAPLKVVRARYQVVYRITQTNTSALYLVKDLDAAHEKFWALKEMRAPAAASAGEAFMREAETLARLNHPNLPRLLEGFTFEERQYLVMEHMRGQTLAMLLHKQSSPLSLTEVACWANQLFGVFQYLHDQTPPILYRDLKPSNVMMEDDSGLLKLMDCGDAAIGTLGYAAPEQWQRGESTSQSDIYALAVLLHQLLTRHDPTTTPFNLPALATLNAAVPAGVADAIAKGCAPDRRDRYATMRDFQAAFQQATQMV